MTDEKNPSSESRSDSTVETISNEATCPYPISDPILERIGETPFIDYPNPSTGGTLSIKLESYNPTGSMKDRIALGMIRELEADGQLTDNDIVVEASSGNTAGAVALVTNRLGYDSILTTPAGTSSQKIGYVRAFGSEIVECPDVDSNHADHYRNTAKHIAAEHGGVWLDQYSNQLNPTVHYKWTGPELWRQADNDLTHIVCPMGTGGTISGIAKYVKEQNPDVRVVGVDAEHSNISSSFYESENVPYDTAVEGLGKGHELPTMWFSYIDEVQSVTDEQAFTQARRTATDCGVLVGGSSGAAIHIAREISSKQSDVNIAVVACDGGEQYFDTIFDETWMQERGYSTDTSN